jgi:hypothetical protein
MDGKEVAHISRKEVVYGSPKTKKLFLPLCLNQED